MEKRCKTENCRKKAQHHRTICRSCRTAREREKDPVRYSWLNHRKNAKHRGIPFDLPIDYYRDHVIKTGYMARKGRHKDSWHLDRIIEDRSIGYVVGNIQNLSNSDNVKKFLDYKYCHIRQKMEFKMQTITLNEQGNAPF